MSAPPPTIAHENPRVALAEDPAGFLASCQAKWGKVFTIPFETPVTYVLDASAYRAILTSRKVDFAPVSRQSKRRFELGALVETEADVRALSHDFIRALRGRVLQRIVGRLEAALERHTAAWQATIPSRADLTLDALVDATLVPASVEALFGVSAVDESLAADIETFSASVAMRLTGADPTLNRGGRAAEERLMERFETCLKLSDAPMLEALRDGVMADPAVTDDARVRMLLMLMWGSLVNLKPTSVWLAASVYRLEGLQGQLREELEQPRAPLTASVVQETLRMFSRPNMYRAVVEDFDVTFSSGQTYRLAAGSWVALFPQLHHRDGTSFLEPLRFAPDRFLPATLEQPHRGARPSALVVFGMGKGRCPGDTYAQTALALTLQSWLTHFEGWVDPAARLPPAVLKTVASTPGPSQPIAARLTRLGPGV
jgi:cytochrome P450